MITIAAIGCIYYAISAFLTLIAGNLAIEAAEERRG